MNAAAPTARPRLVPVGDNATRIWGMSNAERVRRIRAAQKLDGDASGGELLANLAYAFDPVWTSHLAGMPNTVVTRGGVPVLAHVRDAPRREMAERAMLNDAPLPPGTGLGVIEAEDEAGILNAALRKRERPFAERLTPATVALVERASYQGAYKGVTDLLTKYLWPEWAFALTRVAARLGVTPNQVTTLGAVLCVLAALLFWNGWFWTGMLAGLGFMVLDTVDGKLARCTITSSKWGDVFDHGIDLVHPPFWWWAWAVGLERAGLGYPGATFAWVIGAILAGYVVQRLIEGAFIKRFNMHIHVWRKLDSDFRLITARRNPNMVILFASVLFGRPDIGLIAVAVWTVLSCLFHLVRLAQAFAEERRGRPVLSWLS